MDPKDEQTIQEILEFVETHSGDFMPRCEFWEIEEIRRLAQEVQDPEPDTETTT